MKILIRKIKYENITLEEIDSEFLKNGKEYVCDADKKEVITEIIYF